MINYFFKTYGCQANVADSDSVAKFLKSLGGTEVAVEEAADLIIVNTCAVRDKAEQKLFSYLGRLSDIKLSKPYIKIGVIGCVASYKKAEIYQRFDQVSFVYGARDEMDTFHAYLTDVLVSIETLKQLYVDKPNTPFHNGQDRDVKKIVATKGLLSKSKLMGASRLKNRLSLGKKQLESPLAKPFEKPKEVSRSFINIMTGCDKYCAYCIVPFTRGKEVSYSVAKIVARAEHDIRNGAKEVTLVGQNVNSYIDPDTQEDFSALLRKIVKIDGEFWVRWISPHPQDMTPELFDVIAANQDKIPAYVHFPVQAGANRVLELMRRTYTVEQYLEQIGWLRDRMPDAVISTDIIVGFPGETEEEYQETRKLMETVKFDFIYSFIYSPRRYTRAFKMEDPVPKEAKAKWLTDLQERQKDICLEKNQRHVGKTMKTLVEKRLENGKLLARTEGSVRVVFEGSNEMIGTFLYLNITRASPANLFGEVAVNVSNSACRSIHSSESAL